MKLPRFVDCQYRTINVKTVSREALDLLRAAFLSHDSARVAWVVHPPEDDTPEHYHICASFTSPVRFHDVLARLYELDNHEYCKPCRNFRQSVRYLAHLDNPEKIPIPLESVCFEGDWDGVNRLCLMERRNRGLDVLDLLGFVAAYRETLPSGVRFRPILFAIWLESHAIDPKKVFSMVRQMGLGWEEIIEESIASCSGALNNEISENV